MRRSTCPSQVRKAFASNGNCSTKTSSSAILSSNILRDKSNKSYTGISGDDNVIIRMPLFGFLEVPDALRKEFRIPSGCMITKESIELRKRRSLGGNRLFKRITPEDLMGLGGVRRQTCPVLDGEEEDDAENLEGVCQSALPPFEPLVLWQDQNDPSNKIEVMPELACKLRPHQREGVQFLFECTMGLRGFEGQGCILADDMGLGKTLMSITMMWTLLNQGFIKGEPAVRKVVVVCPTSLVGNWDNEIRKWVGDRCPTFPVKSDPKKIIQSFIQYRTKAVLIVSYETQRRFSGLFESKPLTAGRQLSGQTSYCSCDLLICDEAHKLKNAESGLACNLNSLPAKKRILLSGTPMQNELGEFFNMVNFCNPGVLGSISEFRRRYERPILQSREPDAHEADVAKAAALQKELSTIVNEFILKRGNILNAQHLPPKLVQFVCCQLSSVQSKVYDAILGSKEARHIREGKQTDTLGTLRQLINVCSHPRLVLESCRTKLSETQGRDEDARAMFALLMDLGVAVKGQVNSTASSSGASRGPGGARSGGGASRQGSSAGSDWVDAELSGKLSVLCRMMLTLRALKTGERIVVVSNYTQTLDLIQKLCDQNKWPVLRLDGSVNGNKRTQLVDKFNDPNSAQFAFLLSSKAGGCGINLIGGSRLVLFDPDWNPASDKQAAGRIWREGQKRRCFIYRFMSTGTVEEKIVQRQLSKEGLQNIVDDKDQVNVFSSEELRSIFIRRDDGTPSDTHDTLRCKRCPNVRAADPAITAQRNTLTQLQAEECAKFTRDFIVHLTKWTAVTDIEGSALKEGDNGAILKEGCVEIEETPGTTSPLSIFDGFNDVLTQLESGSFATLSQFSKALREAVNQVDREVAAADAAGMPPLLNLPKGCSAGTEYVGRWSVLVPVLAEMRRGHMHELAQQRRGVKVGQAACSLAGEGGEGRDEEGEDDCEAHAEQEGCPEENDFNKWSHHSSVKTCDDEVLRLAVADDPTVSFVFGLEVDWGLLQRREADTREAEMRRREQQRMDLEALNERRRWERVRAGNGDEEGRNGEELRLSNGVDRGLKLADVKGNRKGTSKKVNGNARDVKRKQTEKEVLTVEDDGNSNDLNSCSDNEVVVLSTRKNFVTRSPNERTRPYRHQPQSVNNNKDNELSNSSRMDSMVFAKRRRDRPVDCTKPIYDDCSSDGDDDDDDDDDDVNTAARVGIDYEGANSHTEIEYDCGDVPLVRNRKATTIFGQLPIRDVTFSRTEVTRNLDPPNSTYKLPRPGPNPAHVRKHSTNYEFQADAAGYVALHGSTTEGVNGVKAPLRKRPISTEEFTEYSPRPVLGVLGSVVPKPLRPLTVPVPQSSTEDHYPSPLLTQITRRSKRIIVDSDDECDVVMSSLKSSHNQNYDCDVLPPSSNSTLTKKIKHSAPLDDITNCPNV